MITIAASPPTTFLRQEHAHELNGVLISNRLAHAELLGTMEKQDFAFAMGIRRCGHQNQKTAAMVRRCMEWPHAGRNSFAALDGIECIWQLDAEPTQNGQIARCIYGGDPLEHIEAQTIHSLHPCPCLVAHSPYGCFGTRGKLYRERAWETRRGAWRRLRHDRAMMCFRTDLRAPNFTNPPQRVALFREFKEGQALRHEKRVALLRDLCGRRPVDAAGERPGSVVDEEQKVRGGSTAVNAFKLSERALNGSWFAQDCSTPGDALHWVANLCCSRGGSSCRADMRDIFCLSERRERSVR